MSFTQFTKLFRAVHEPMRRSEGVLRITRAVGYPELLRERCPLIGPRSWSLSELLTRNGSGRTALHNLQLGGPVFRMDLYNIVDSPPVTYLEWSTVLVLDDVHDGSFLSVRSVNAHCHDRGMTRSCRKKYRNHSTDRSGTSNVTTLMSRF